jgi:hypothetical protein
VAESSDRVALPIRVHDFLLACAGRIDDDALTDARELLAVAELDRAVDLVTAGLVAGRIPLSADERDELRELVATVRSSPALVDRIIVNDRVTLPRHRFTTGVMDDPAPDGGVLDAVGRVVEVLPDIRALSCVWRTTPAGAPAGPVPQRLVLVETGPDGFAPSTAYRVEQALRRNGIRAVVEVIQAGSEVTDYHADALAVARRVSLRAPAGRAHESAEGESLFTDSPSPRPVTSTRRRYASGAHAEKRSTVDASSGRWQPRVAASDEPDAEPDPAATSPYEAGVRPIHAEPVRAEPVRPEAVRPEPLRAESARVEPGRVEPLRPGPESVRGEPKHPEPVAEVVSEPVLPPLALPDPAADADLSTKERELLRQLHEELAKREGELPEEQNWQADRATGGQRHGVGPGQASVGEHSGFRHAEFDPAEFGGPAWHQGAADQTAVNGIPPYGGAQA